MALTRTLPIKDRVFNGRSLGPLLQQIGDYFSPSEDPYSRCQYRLQISEDDHTTVTLDTPPKNIDALLGTPISSIRLEMRTSVPTLRTADFTLIAGELSNHSHIILHGEDEDWVNLAYVKLSKLIAQAEIQPNFIHKYYSWVFLPVSMVMGWPIQWCFYLFMSMNGQLVKSTHAWMAFGQHVLIALIFGLVPTFFLLNYAQAAYPSIEIQTGPRNTWLGATRRRILMSSAGIFIVGPSANMLYDIYKSFA